jgi:spore maturation protein CgeB
LESSASKKVFYDMDTPVTLSRFKRGETVDYLPSDGLGNFDVVLSYTGGAALGQLRELLGARTVAPLYGWVDPEVHYPVDGTGQYTADLSYLGTFAADRQHAMDELLIAPARQSPHNRFLIGGPMYPDSHKWPPNVAYRSHVPPSEHPAFYCSSRLTLNITRASMAAMGYCPSGRLFEAAACGTPVLSDWWEGLDEFFDPGEEILTANSSQDTLAALRRHPGELGAIGLCARERVLDCHTAEIRARQFVDLMERRDSVERFESSAYACKGA